MAISVKATRSPSAIDQCERYIDRYIIQFFARNPGLNVVSMHVTILVEKTRLGKELTEKEIARLVARYRPKRKGWERVEYDTTKHRIVFVRPTEESG